MQLALALWLSLMFWGTRRQLQCLWLSHWAIVPPASGSCWSMAPSVKEPERAEASQKTRRPTQCSIVALPHAHPGPSQQVTCGHNCSSALNLGSLCPLSTSMKSAIVQSSHNFFRIKCYGLNDVCTKGNVGSPSSQSLAEVPWQLRPRNYSTVNKTYCESCLNSIVFLLYREIQIMLRGLGTAQSAGKLSGLEFRCPAPT